jgi:hypothetical protein
MLQPGPDEKRVLCIPCYKWEHSHNGQDRPAHITTRQTEKLVCVTCETVSVTGWRWYSTPEGYECRKCHVQANILPKPRVCVSCNAESPDILDEQLRMCGGCHERTGDPETAVTSRAKLGSTRTLSGDRPSKGRALPTSLNICCVSTPSTGEWRPSRPQGASRVFTIGAGIPPPRPLPHDSNSSIVGLFF